MRLLLLLTVVLSALALVCAHVEQTTRKPVTAPVTVPTTAPIPRDTCPRPTPEMVKCLQQWACQYVIRLDLRCLLNLNGNPLLGGLLGGGSGGGGGGGILGNLLGGKK